MKTFASLTAVLLLLGLSASAATTVNTGVIKATFTITIASTNLLTKDIRCTVLASVSDVNNSTFETRFASETASVLATHTSGASTATCTVNIPYKWTLSSASTDKINISYELFSPATFATGSNGLPNRSSSQTISNTVLVTAPAASKVFTVAATI